MVLKALNKSKSVAVQVGDQDDGTLHHLLHQYVQGMHSEEGPGSQLTGSSGTAEPASQMSLKSNLEVVINLTRTRCLVSFFVC